MLRLFIAVDFPAPVREQVLNIQGKLKETGPDVKWVEDQNLHLTLKFLGDTPKAEVPRIEGALARAAASNEPFEVSIGGLGAFPNLREPRVIWLGINDPGRRFTALADVIDDELARVGIPRETKAYKPHLTLGRVRSPRGLEQMRAELTKLLDAAVEDTCRVKSFALIKSELTKGGPVYTVLGEYQLE